LRNLLDKNINKREKEKMEIKCPICGKKYHYDRKICQECEDYSIYSGLADINNKKNHKWNCSIFLGCDTIAFKTSKTWELTKNLTPEPENFAIHEKELYDWNCETVNRSKGYKESSPMKQLLENFSAKNKNKIGIVRSKSIASLIYE
jgi:hypothetical protein